MFNIANNAVKHVAHNIIPLTKQTARYGVVFAAVYVTAEGAKNVFAK